MSNKEQLFRINDKVVVITGASSGFSEATARHLAAKGGSVVLDARTKDRRTPVACCVRL